MNKIKWIIAQNNEGLNGHIAHQFGIDPTIAQLLINRGLKRQEDIQGFFNPNLDNLEDPFSLEGIDRAVNRIKQAIKNEEKILIYGDYDVDGITSIALLFAVIKDFGTNIYYYIPDRSEEGYSISQKGIEFAVKYNISLIITVDCGVTSHQEIKQLNDLKIDTIITDHHQPQKDLPSAYTIINPKCDHYPFKELAGVGVTFKLAQAIYAASGKKDEALNEHLDLVALGTIADSVPLVGENRILVKYGINQIVKSHKLGLKTLLRHEYNENKASSLMVEDIAFHLIPVLNSTGRIGNPHNAVDLLLTDSFYRAQCLVVDMLKLNEERKVLTQKVLVEARQMAVKKNEVSQQSILILASRQWHPGIVGIVASRIMEEFQKPVIIISINDGIGKGSGRNQGTFDFSKILFDCSELLIQYGGHQSAAGIAISEEKIEAFSQKINQLLNIHPSMNADNERVIQIDTKIEFDQINWGFLNTLEKFRPFGPGNPQPIFGGYRFPLTSWKKVGRNERHLKIHLGKSPAYINGIAFQMNEEVMTNKNDGTIDIAFHLSTNCWNGEKSIQLIIKDIK